MYYMTIDRGAEHWESTTKGDSYGDAALAIVFHTLSDDFGLSKVEVDRIEAGIRAKYEVDGGLDIKPGSKFRYTSPDGVVIAIDRDNT